MESVLYEDATCTCPDAGRQDSNSNGRSTGTDSRSDGMHKDGDSAPSPLGMITFGDRDNDIGQQDLGIS